MLAVGSHVISLRPGAPSVVLVVQGNADVAATADGSSSEGITQ